jgi:4-amino-4-deoxy-L-arabinose transferase-like glycosyltransferase
LRVVASDSQALWGDEGMTLVLAHWPASEMLLHPTDPTPAFYYWLHKTIVSTHMSAGFVRGISIVCGVASVGLMYLMGRLSFGPRLGLLGAALLAVWPQHIDYSQEARAYSLLFLLTLASATSLLWWLREVEKDEQVACKPCRISALLAFAVSTAFSFHTHLVAVPWIVVALCILLTSKATTGPRYRGETIAALGLMGLLAVPGLVRFARQLATPNPGFNWLEQASPANFLSTTLELLLPLRFKAGGDTISSGVSTYQIGFLILALLLVRFARSGEAQDLPKPDRSTRRVMLAFLSLPLLIWLLGFVVSPIFMERTILFAIPGAVLALIAIASLLPDRRVQTGFAALTLAAFTGSAFAGGLMRPKEDWRGAYRALAGQVAAGDLILFCSWKYPAMRHAVSAPVPAPVLMFHLPGEVAIAPEAKLGSRPDWDRLYFRYVVEPDMPGKPAASLEAIQMVAQAGRAIWLVDSWCPERSRSEMLSKLPNNLRWRRAWDSPPNFARPVIAIDRAVTVIPVGIPVLVPPELGMGGPVQ